MTSKWFWKWPQARGRSTGRIPTIGASETTVNSQPQAEAGKPAQGPAACQPGSQAEEAEATAQSPQPFNAAAKKNKPRQRQEKRADVQARRNQRRAGSKPARTLQPQPDASGRGHGSRASERMSQKQENLIVVLDIGSAWTRVLAADLNEGALRYRGHGVVESAGMRKGLISELAPAAKAVQSGQRAGRACGWRQYRRVRRGRRRAAYSRPQYPRRF